jgi:DNA-directed RNA polymerase subunit RPC12/RpoP
MAFTCASCGQTFDDDEEWAADGAIREKEALFGDVPLDECVIVCEDCYYRIMEVC